MMKRNLTEYEIDFILDFIIPQNGIPFDSAMSIVENNKNRLKSQLIMQMVYPSIIPELKEKIRSSYVKTIIHPGESVGILTAQSIGEKQTQLTLNSITYESEIIIRDNNLNGVVTQIGVLIDNLLLKHKKTIEYISINRTEFLNIEQYNLYIPSCDENGTTSWDRIIGVSKHLPNGNLVKIITQLGREVIATQSKSFITWDGEKFVSTYGSDIKIGDIVPTISNLVNKHFQTEGNRIYYLNVGQFFSKDKYQDIIIPYSYDFGFFIGVFLSEKHIVRRLIDIRNKNPIIVKNIIEFMDSLCIKTTITPSGNKLYINSNMLFELLNMTCGVGSKKIVPKFAIACNTTLEFVQGIISGFYSSIGIIDKRDYSINICSISKELIHGISFLLSQLGIVGKFSTIKKGVQVQVTFSIRNRYAKMFAEYFIWEDKEKILEKCVNRQLLYEYGKYMKDYPHNTDIYFDRIISVESIDESLHPFVYDFETENTKNFALYNGLVCRDSFHKAGLADKMVVSGVSKFSELVNATKNPKEPSCVVYFNENNSSIQELRDSIGSSLIEHTLKSISSSIEVFIEKEAEPWYDSYKILYNDNFSKYRDCVSIKLKLNILFELKLNIDEIVFFIESEYSDMSCVFSSTGQLDIFIDTSNINLPEDRKIFIDSGPLGYGINVIYLEEVVVPTLENLKICGIAGIKNMFYIKNESENNWYIETDGCNFNKILAHPKVNMKKVISNNVWDIYNTLGIEAAREFLINEFSVIMEGVTACHIKLLVERMTFSGSITSISRYTMRTDESGPLGKCSFEESIDGFCKAGVYGEEEPTRGVSSCIIVGKRSNIGTGCMDLRIDIAKLPTAVSILSEVKETM